MAGKVLYLFPDTNVFIQCKGLQDCDWSFLSEFDEVQLIVCRPVQREIDRLKNRGNDRVGKKAREAATFLRNLLQSGSQTIRYARPSVTIRVSMEFNYSDQRGDVLNLDEPDDQLIGCALDFIQKNLHCDARVLTDDGGPMATADLVGVGYLPVPEDWKLLPEASVDDKKLQELQQENKRLKAAEPSFEIRAVSESGDSVQTFSRSLQLPAPLTGGQLDDLVRELAARFPMVTDFTQTPQELALKHVGGHRVRYVPPEEIDIKAYTSEHYPAWIATCREIFAGMFSLTEQRIRMRFFIRNTGTRPAINARIEFVAHGNFRIMRPDQNEDDHDSEKNSDRLPAPPRAPRGNWELEALKGMVNTSRIVNDILRQASPGPFADHAHLSRLPFIHDFPKPRNPETFYYTDASVDRGNMVSLTCQRWRHSIAEKPFEVDICFNDDIVNVAGAVECRIHADNLSTPALKTTPVRMTIQRDCLVKKGRELINELDNRPLPSTQ